MKPEVLFVIGAQRSGTTLLERILSSHPLIQGGAEPHLLTPLAHLGVWKKVDKAPYDHIVAALGQQAFVEQLPNRHMDYWRACRAYCDALYESHMRYSGKKICLDKTPEYATVLPFVNKVFPDAKYIVLTRHPVAVFSSFANSFFDGDYALAYDHEPLLERYIPPIAAFLRQTLIPFVHVRYEQLVGNPEAELKRIYQFLEVPFDAQTIAYQEKPSRRHKSSQLGDPLGVRRYRQPSDASLTKWVEDLKFDEQAYHFMQDIIARLEPADLETVGYPLDELWAPMKRPVSRSKASFDMRFDRYRLERKLIVGARAAVRRTSWVERLVKQCRLICDVLLRE